MGRQKVEMSCGFFTSMLFSRDPSVQPKEGRTNNAKKKKIQFHIEKLEREGQVTSSGLKNTGR